MPDLDFGDSTTIVTTISSIAVAVTYLRAKVLNLDDRIRRIEHLLDERLIDTVITPPRIRRG